MIAALCELARIDDALSKHFGQKKVPAFRLLCFLVPHLQSGVSGNDVKYQHDCAMMENDKTGCSVPFSFASFIPASAFYLSLQSMYSQMKYRVFGQTLTTIGLPLLGGVLGNILGGKPLQNFGSSADVIVRHVLCFDWSQLLTLRGSVSRQRPLAASGSSE